MLALVLTLLSTTVVPADGRLAECTAVVASRRVGCGRPVDLAPGTYTAWMERGGEITPFLSEVRSGETVTVDGPLVAAGEVRAREPVRLFDVETRAGFRQAFERPVTGSATAPAGRAVAAVTDDRGAIVGLSRPVVVTPGRAAAVAAAPGTHVIALLTRPRRPAADARDEVTVALGGRSPDVFSDAGNRGDELGRYELLLWQPRMYEVVVTLQNADGAPPMRDFIRISRDTTYDIDVPKTDVRVRVLDARSGSPLAGADVGVLNAWGGSEERPAHRQTQNVKSDRDGVARFAPLRPGKATVYASAAGYFAATPQTLTVTADSHAVIDVRLEPEGEVHSVELLLPDGTPAAGAEVAVENWTSTAAPDGRVGIPRAFTGAFVFVRHPRAAAGVRRLDGRDESWRLGAAAPPLRLQVERWTGWPEPAVVTVWIDGVPVSGRMLRFLTRAPASLPSHGDWIAYNLPAVPLRIVASRSPATLAPAAREALASIVPFPWPAGATIRVTH